MRTFKVDVFKKNPLGLKGQLYSRVLVIEAKSEKSAIAKAKKYYTEQIADTLHFAILYN